MNVTAGSRVIPVAVAPATAGAEVDIHMGEDSAVKASFQIRNEVLPMRLEREGMTPHEIAAIWEEWGCKFASRIRFAAQPGSSGGKWLNAREDAVPTSPAVVRLEGAGALLDSLAAALQQRTSARGQR